MDINFKQGIIEATPNFLQKTGGSVSLHASDDNPVYYTCASGSVNYVILENETTHNAWSINLTDDSWLYCDINPRTAERTFGVTLVNPLGKGNNLPTAPLNDTHFYDMVDDQLHLFSGGKWSKVLRVFMGSYVGGVFTEMGVGSQINLYKSVSAGFILRDSDDNPLKDNQGKFLTTASFMYISNDKYNSIRPEMLLNAARATEPIPKYHCVSLIDRNRMVLTRQQTYDKPCVGIVVHNTNVDEVKRYVTRGILTNRDWNFTAPPMTAVWVGASGEVTTKVPTRYSMQRLGCVVNRTTILVDIQEIIIIDYKYEPIIPLTPTPTISVTPTEEEGF